MHSTRAVPVVAGVVPAFRTGTGGADIPWAGGSISVNAAGLRLLQQMDGRRTVAELLAGEGADGAGLRFLDTLATVGLVTLGDRAKALRRGWIKTTRLIAVSIEVIQRCNQNCKRCYLRNSLPAAQQLSLAELDRLFGELVSYGVTSICLSGGEPLLRPDLLAIVRGARDHGLEVAIATNATLLTPRLARSLRRLGVGMLQISVDGLRRTHDRIRREPGAFGRVRDAFRLCGSAGLVAFAITGVNRENVSEIPELNRTLGRWGVPGHMIVRYVPSGVADEDFGCVSRDELAGLGERLRRGHETQIKSCDPVINRLLGRAGSCGAGYYGASIMADGTVKICDTLPWKMGSIRTQSVGAVFEGSSFIHRLVRRHQNLQAYPGLADDPCYGCVAFQCLASGAADHQDPFHPAATADLPLPKAASTAAAPVPFVRPRRRISAPGAVSR